MQLITQRLIVASRKTIESLAPSEGAMWPEGLHNSLKKDEFQDLLAFLLARGHTQRAMYR